MPYRPDFTLLSDRAADRLVATEGDRSFEVAASGATLIDDPLFGRAVELGGEDGLDAGVLPVFRVTDGSPALTCAFWMRPSALHAPGGLPQVVLSSLDGANEALGGLQVVLDGRLKLQLAREGSGAAPALTFSVKRPELWGEADRWTHVAVVVDRSARLGWQARLFVDGEPLIERPGARSSERFDLRADRLIFGAATPAGAVALSCRAFRGRLARVSVWRQALDSSALLEHRAASLPLPERLELAEASIMAELRLDALVQSLGESVFEDGSGNGRHGRPQGVGQVVQDDVRGAVTAIGGSSRIRVPCPGMGLSRNEQVQGLSVMVWVRPDDLAAAERPLLSSELAQQASAPAWQLRIGEGRARARLVATDGSTIELAAPPGALEPGRWHHLQLDLEVDKEKADDARFARLILDGSIVANASPAGLRIPDRPGVWIGGSPRESAAAARVHSLRIARWAGRLEASALRERDRLEKQAAAVAEAPAAVEPPAVEGPVVQAAPVASVAPALEPAAGPTPAVAPQPLPFEPVAATAETGDGALLELGPEPGRPLEFDLLDAEGEPRIYLLAERQSLRLELRNASPRRTLRFGALEEPVGPENHHLELRFRAGVLDPERLDALRLDHRAEESGWALAARKESDPSDHAVSVFLKTSREIQMPPGRALNLIFRDAHPDRQGATRGSRVQLRWRGVSASPDDEPIDSNGLRYIELVHAASAATRFPLRAGLACAPFLMTGSNGTNDSLSLRLVNTSRRLVLPASATSEAPPTIRIEVPARTVTEPWGVVEQVEDVSFRPSVDLSMGWHGRSERNVYTLIWRGTGGAIGAGHFCDFEIDGLEVGATSGTSALRVSFENFPNPERPGEALGDIVQELPLLKVPFEVADHYGTEAENTRISGKLGLWAQPEIRLHQAAYDPENDADRPEAILGLEGRDNKLRVVAPGGVVIQPSESASASVAITGDKVGIGTTTPESRFHVSGGTARFDQGIEVPGGGGGGVSVKGDKVGIGTITPESRFHVSGGTARFDLGIEVPGGGGGVSVKGDKVGIGTITPAAKLHVKGGTALFEEGIDTPRMGPITVTQDRYQTVGIGASEPHPWPTLHVQAKTGQATPPEIARFQGTQRNFLSIAQSSDAGSAMSIESHSTTTQYVPNQLLLNPNGGNVGIGTGTSAPTATLHVSSPSGQSGPVLQLGKWKIIASDDALVFQHQDTGKAGLFLHKRAEDLIKGPFGGPEGAGFSAQQPYRISKIGLRRGRLIDALTFWWRLPGGQCNAGYWGGGGGSWYEFLIPEGDYLTKVEGTHNGAHICSLKFVTRNNAQYEHVGATAANSFVLQGPAGTQIVGFFGQSRDYLDALGCFCAPFPA